MDKFIVISISVRLRRPLPKAIMVHWLKFTS